MERAVLWHPPPLFGTLHQRANVEWASSQHARGRALHVGELDVLQQFGAAEDDVAAAHGSDAALDWDDLTDWYVDPDQQGQFVPPLPRICAAAATYFFKSDDNVTSLLKTTQCAVQLQKV